MSAVREVEDGAREPLWLSRPYNLTISITETCNLRCLHCYSDCGSSCAAELSTQEWLGFIDRLSEDGFISVFFEGGEPFMRGDFEEIVAYAARRLLVMIRTNGTLLDEDRVRRLQPIVGRLYVDVLGASASTHDALTGAEGSFAQAMAGISRARAAGLPVTMLLILNRINAADIPAYLDLAARSGVDEVGILRLYPLGRAKRNWSELALSIEEMTSALADLPVREGLRVMHSWHPHSKNCCWHNAAVLASGRSVGCPYLREYVDYGDIRRQSFLETWAHPLYRELRSGRVTSSCGSCSANEHTDGGCRSTAYAFRGRFDAPDPFCSDLNAGVDLRVLPDRLL